MIGKTAPTPRRVIVGDGRELTQALANATKISVVLDRLCDHINSRNQCSSPELFSLCLSLARGIDFAIGNNDPIDRFVKLKPLLDQISKLNSEPYLHVAVTTLMISVKHACMYGWFPDRSEKYISLANELQKSFSSEVYKDETSNSSTKILTVMARFYPSMKVGKILSSFEVKQGYGTYLVDFHVLKNGGQSLEEKVYLLVFETEKIETSACIITPQRANFLLNGKGVNKRVNVCMNNGPQLPTDLTELVQFGSNIIQAIGQFDGHYSIVLAFMSTQSIPEMPLLQAFTSSDVPAVESDSEVIEGPTRIMLNCPISCSRIKTPVKGKSCKHLQCFDFKNFVDINSRRPSWRCPLCNQSCSYLDIRLDQHIFKVLEEVGEDVNGVVISSDGSWSAVAENNNPDMEASQSAVINNAVHLQPVLDLTDDKDEGLHLDDKKPVVYTKDVIQQTSIPTGRDFWLNILQESQSLSNTPVEPLASQFQSHGNMLHQALHHQNSPSFSASSVAAHLQPSYSTSPYSYFGPFSAPPPRIQPTGPVPFSTPPPRIQPTGPAPFSAPPHRIQPTGPVQWPSMPPHQAPIRHAPPRRPPFQTSQRVTVSPPSQQRSHHSPYTPNGWESVRFSDATNVPGGYGYFNSPAFAGSRPRPVIGIADNSIGIPTVSPVRTPPPHLQAIVNRGTKFTSQPSIPNQHNP